MCRNIKTMYTGIFTSATPTEAQRITDDLTKPLEDLKVKINAAIITSDKGFPDVDDLHS